MASYIDDAKDRGVGDGVVGRLDKCPNTRTVAQVDIAGCKIKEEIRLPDVNFESNSDRLLPGAESVLQDAASTLLRNPTIRVEGRDIPTATVRQTTTGASHHAGRRRCAII